MTNSITESLLAGLPAHIPPPEVQVFGDVDGIIELLWKKDSYHWLQVTVKHAVLKYGFRCGPSHQNGSGPFDGTMPADVRDLLDRLYPVNP